jgi:hypothetical protein
MTKLGLGKWLNLNADIQPEAAKSLLKGQYHEIFNPHFFSLINPPWLAGYHPRILSNYVSISQIYSNSAEEIPQTFKLCKEH